MTIYIFYERLYTFTAGTQLKREKRFNNWYPRAKGDKLLSEAIAYKSRFCRNESAR